MRSELKNVTKKICFKFRRQRYEKRKNKRLQINR